MDNVRFAFVDNVKTTCFVLILDSNGFAAASKHRFRLIQISSDNIILHKKKCDSAL